MTPERLEQLRAAFPLVFGIPFEEGGRQVAFLTHNYTSMAKMNPYLERAAIQHGVPVMSANVRMDERDFAMVAFFALMGLETSGMSVEEPAPKPVEQSVAERKKLRGNHE